MRLLVCGDRNWTDFNAIYNLIKHVNPDVVIEGGAKGADTIARHAAVQLGIPYEEYRAEWDKYGRAAGPIRNQRMLDEGKPDRVSAFHHNISESKGTLSMVKLAMKAGIQTEILGGS